MRHDTVAFVMIKTELGQAGAVAEGVSKVAGVKWAVEVAGTEFRVIALLHVENNMVLGLSLRDIENVDGVRNPVAAVRCGPRNGPP